MRRTVRREAPLPAVAALRGAGPQLVRLRVVHGDAGAHARRGLGQPEAGAAVPGPAVAPEPGTYAGPQANIGN